MKGGLSDDLTSAALAGLVEAVREIRDALASQYPSGSGQAEALGQARRTLDRVEATIQRAAELRGHTRRQGEGFREFIQRTAK